MDTDDRPRRALAAAIERLLRPLCRLLLRHSVSFGAFEEIAKRVYVDVARKDFTIPGRKPTTSRVAVLSGLTRKEVQRLLGDAGEDVAEAAGRYNRASRVLTGWARDADFLDAAGRPRPLDTDGADGFAGLVRRHSGDMPARSVLDELLRVGAVRQRDDGRLELLTPAYVPQGSAVDKLDILGRDVADLIATIDHNLQHGTTDPRFQRKVMYDAVPQSALPALRKLGAQRGQALLEQLDRWLATREREPSPDDAGAAPMRAGFGIYYFEEPLDPSDTEGDPR